MITQHPEDPNDPTVWFNRFGVALACATVDELGGYELYDAFVYRLGEADSPEDLGPEDRAMFERLEARVNAGASPYLQYEARGDWAAEDALDEAEPAQVKAVDDEDDWVGL